MKINSKRNKKELIKETKMKRILFESESGAILPIVLILALALIIIGVAFLNAGVMENRLARREDYKNQAFYLAEAGIEEFKVRLNSGEDEPQIPWTPLGNGDYMLEGFYGEMRAESTGRIIKNNQEILRKIRVTIHEEGVFDYAIFADKSMRMTGHAGEYKVSSYHSGDPAFPADQATIGTNGSQANAMDLQNSLINGWAKAGPGADLEEAITLGPNGEITQGTDWLSQKRPMPIIIPAGVESLPDKGPLTISGEGVYLSESGSYSSITIGGATQELAANGGSTYFVGPTPMVPESETIRVEERDPVTEEVVSTTPMARGVDYTIDYDTGEITFLLVPPIPPISPGGNNNYIVVAIEGNLIIDSDCLLAVETLTVHGGGSVVITGGATVTFYVEQEIKIGGNGFVNESEIASQLRIYGGANCTTVEVGGTPDFYGVIYAPKASIVCNGTNDIYGSLVGEEVTVKGTPNIFWDAALKDDDSLPPVRTLENWEEVFS